MTATLHCERYIDVALSYFSLAYTAALTFRNECAEVRLDCDSRVGVFLANVRESVRLVYEICDTECSRWITWVWKC